MAHALVRAAPRLLSTVADVWMRTLSCSTNFAGMAPHRRRLPHIYPEGAALFLTWHLHGSVPASLFPPPGPLSHGQAFMCLDRQLDTLRHGPLYLRRPDIASIVVDSIRKGVELCQYELIAYVVMANHVHLLIWPRIAPDRLLKSLKGATAREANRVLGRTGEPFWQKESYDHCVRNPSEFEKIRTYIETNPVQAGLVQSPQDYPWSSAGVEKSLDAARTSACATYKIRLALIGLPACLKEDEAPWM
ncbi:MAG: transposase [Acidobacteriia bacterium]|nr:transposase [Terriglobia bacterium]